jgi:hypothetical protein
MPDEGGIDAGAGYRRRVAAGLSYRLMKELRSELGLFDEE